MAKGRCLCNPIYRFLKEFNLSTLSTSNVSDEWKGWHHLHNHGGLSSQAKVRDQVERLNKIGVITMKIGINREVRKNWKVRDFVSIRSVIYICSFAVLF